MDTFKLRVMTPYKIIFDGEAKSVVSKSEEGEFSIMADFENYITTTLPTRMSIIDEKGSELEYFASGGVLEVRNGVVNFCIDTVESKEDIDVKRAELSKERAEERLEKANEERLSQMRAKLALDRAIARIEIAKSLRK